MNGAVVVNGVFDATAPIGPYQPHVPRVDHGWRPNRALNWQNETKLMATSTDAPDTIATAPAYRLAVALLLVLQGAACGTSGSLPTLSEVDREVLARNWPQAIPVIDELTQPHPDRQSLTGSILDFAGLLPPNPDAQTIVDSIVRTAHLLRGPSRGLTAPEHLALRSTKTIAIPLPTANGQPRETTPVIPGLPESLRHLENRPLSDKERVMLRHARSIELKDLLR